MCSDTGGSVAARYLVAVSPIAVVSVITASLLPALTEWEGMHPGLLVRLRLVHGVLASALCLVAAIPPAASGESAWLARNALLLLGLGMVSAVAFDPQLSWVAPTSWTAFCYFFGQGGAGGDGPARWAVLLEPHGWRPAILSIGIYAAGLVAFISRGPRRDLAADPV